MEQISYFTKVLTALSGNELLTNVDDPRTTHATTMIMIRQDGEELNTLDCMLYGRISSSVRKKGVFAYVKENQIFYRILVPRYHDQKIVNYDLHDLTLNAS